MPPGRSGRLGVARFQVLEDVLRRRFAVGIRLAVVDEAGLDDGSWALEITMSAARWETMVTKSLPELASYVVASDPAEALAKDSTMETVAL